MGRVWKTSSGTEACATMPCRHVEEMTYSDSGNLAQKNVYLQDLQVAGYTPWTSEAIETNHGRNVEGQVTAVTVKRGFATDASYTYSYDSMARLVGMSGSGGERSDVQCGWADFVDDA